MTVALRSPFVWAVLLPMAFAGIVTACAANPPQKPAASAQLRLADGTQVGTVQFFAGLHGTVGRVELQASQSQTAVRAFHGLHVYANDNPANGEGCIADPAADPASWFQSADGHLKADGEPHGAHTGDLPPLLVNSDGTASAEFATDRVKPSYLIGRAVIVHTGNAGDRLACGAIS